MCGKCTFGGASPLLDIGNGFQHLLVLADRLGLIERIADTAQLAAIAAGFDQHLPLDIYRDGRPRHELGLVLEKLQ